MWGAREHPWEAPDGPITSKRAGYGSSEATYFTCAWDSFLIEEVLSEPYGGAQPELPASELRGDHSVASPNLAYCMRADPVNCATGNLYETYTDLSVPGLNGGLTLTRSYNSEAAVTATTVPMGRGWTFEFNVSLSVSSAAGTATVTNANGATTTFTATGGGAYSAAPWVQAKLALNGEGHYVYTLPDQRTFTFSGEGQLLTIADRNGNTTTMSYTSGRLTTVTDSAGRKLTFAYNTSGLIETIKDPMGHVAKYAYSSGNLTSVTEPGESTPRWQYKYESNVPTEITDGRAGKTTNKFDSSKRVIEQKDPLGRVTKWAYEESGETKITDPTGSITTMQFAGHQPTTITDAVGTTSASTASYVRDGSGNLLSATDGDGHTTKYEYDAEGNRTKTSDATGHETKWTYNGTHDVIGVTTPRGETTTIKRDSHGNAEAVERPAPGETTQTTKYGYDTHGNLTSAENPLKRITKYEYNAYGEPTAETDPEGDKRTRTYDEDAHETATVSPRGNVEGAEASKFTTKTERDARERPIKITDPLGHETKYAYDGNGNLDKLTDPNGHATKYTWDADNENTKVEAANGTVTETGYDAAGRVANQTDGNKHITKYVRDPRGEVTEVVDPLGRKTTKTYDAAGNMVELTDAAKRTAAYAYDPTNRLTEVSYSDETTPGVKYEYDADGERAAMIDGTGTTSYSYDQLDRLTETKDGHGDVISYEYDLGSEQTKITYPSGKAVTRTFDNAGRLAQVTDWLENTTKFAYNADSEPTTTSWPTGTGEEDKYSYNEADQVTKTEMSKGTETLAVLTYTRDNAGQLKTTSKTGLPGESETEYGYDAGNRLTKGGTAAYEYDAANNPTKTGGSTNTYDEASQLKTGTGVSYTYDELGERTKREPAEGETTSYAYDQAGNLTTVSTPPIPFKVTTWNYKYNGDGLRQTEADSGSNFLGITRQLTWDTSGSLPVLISQGGSSYIYGAEGTPIEQIDPEGQAQYLHHDQQGSTRLLTGATGSVEGGTTYDAYGNLIASSGESTTPFGYDGQYKDHAGLLYLRARAYDPATAQFLSRDPLVSVTREPYGYGGANPTNIGDPSGLDILSDAGNLLAGAGNTFTGGISTRVLDALGLPPDTCSGAFKAGGILGYAGFVIPGVGEEELAAEEGGFLFRTGAQTDGALTDASGVSFRDSVSSSTSGTQVFRPGDKIYAVDAAQLPSGSILRDGLPAGHVTVSATPAEIRAAVVGGPLEELGLKPLEDGSFRLPK